MIRNYITIAIRQLLKNKAFSIINISGLAIGMAAFILLTLWIQDEWSYDTYHTKKDRIYELWNKAEWSGELQCWNTTPKIAAKTLRTDFPEIERVTRVDWENNRLLTVGDKKIHSPGNFVDVDFLHIFSFPLISGNIDKVFANPNSVIITKELAQSLFGDENPVGKTIRMENAFDVTVTGIVSTPPGNSRFSFTYLMPWTLHEIQSGENKHWGDNSTRSYVLLKENASIASLQPKIKELRKLHAQGTDVYEMFLYPMERWRLYSTFQNGVENGGRITMVKLMGVIALFILVIAAINFMNLSTARSEKRAKEVGIRKTIGAEKHWLIAQFLGETMLIALISFVLAVVIVQLSLPAYNILTEKKLFIDYASPIFWISSITFIAFTGFLAGSYPAFYLSSFNPIKVLKGTFSPVNAALAPRKVLVVSQFVFAIVLIIATIVVKRQINYVANRDAGYNKEQLVYHFLSNDLEKNYVQLKNELLAQNLAESVTKSSAPLTEGWSDSWDFVWDGKDPNDRTDFDRYIADDAIVKTAGFTLVAGRDFDLKNFSTDSNAAIINESAAKAMNMTDPIGKTIKDGEKSLKVVGLIKDFIIHSPYGPTKPMIIEGANGWFNVIQVRLKNVNNLAQVESLFKKYNPEFPFDYRFMDEAYGAKLNDIKRIEKLATLFAALTIFISCLGLFGLAAYMAENRIKEIGIRKVLGASAIQIVTMLSGNFIKLVFTAFFIAMPLAWWFMYKWLQNFDYRIGIEWWVFVLAGAIAVFISLVTVVYQSLKAAVSNPVKSLRTE